MRLITAIASVLETVGTQMIRVREFGTYSMATQEDFDMLIRLYAIGAICAMPSSKRTRTARRECAGGQNGIGRKDNEVTEQRIDRRQVLKGGGFAILSATTLWSCSRSGPQGRGTEIS